MSVRAEVQPDGSIEIQRPRPSGKSHFIICKDLDGALRIIRFLLKRDLERACRSKFVPEAIKEAHKAFKQLSEESPYAQKKARGTARP